MRSWRPCDICGETRPLIARSPSGSERWCGRCSDSAFDYACLHCDARNDLYTGTCCAACALTAEVQQLFAAAGSSADQWTPLREALLTTDEPLKMINWFKRSRVARLLREVIAAQSPVTHEMLDELPPRSPVHDIRDLLMSCDILPLRDAEYLQRIDAWLRDELASLPASHVRILTLYVRWYVLPKAQRVVARRGVGGSVPAPIPPLFRAAARLLTWLDEVGVGLPELTQPLLDEWLTEGCGYYRHLYPFLNWARTQGITDPGVRVPLPAYPQRANYLDSGERLAQLRRCLDDEALPLHVRVAGALTLLFGLSITKVVQLRRDHVRVDDGAVSLHVDGHLLAIPPKLGKLLRQLATQPTSGTRALSRLSGVSPLLYPGKAAHRPVLPSTLYDRLREHGIPVLSARNTARLALAAELPAAVLGSMTGIEVTTADAWNKRIGHDWTPYIAAEDDAQGGACAANSSASREEAERPRPSSADRSAAFSQSGDR
jgi:hypothetical protein